MARVLIVGGAGFIGSHLARRCLTSGDNLHIAVRKQTDPWRISDIKGNVTIHTVDLSDKQAVKDLITLAAPEVVYYLAAQTKHIQDAAFSDVFSGIENDVMPLLNTLGACAFGNVRSFVRAASLAEYGNGPSPFVESQREKPLNAYAAAMTAGTIYSQMMQPRLPFPTYHARLALTYGPTQSRDFFVVDAIGKCLRGEPIILYRPHDRRDMVFVDDVVEGLTLLASANLDGGTIVNLASGIAHSMRSIAQLVSSLCSVAYSSIEEQPQPDTPFVTKDLRALPDFAMQTLNWCASTSIDIGLEKTISAMRNGAFQDRSKL